MTAFGNGVTRSSHKVIGIFCSYSASSSASPDVPNDVATNLGVDCDVETKGVLDPRWPKQAGTEKEHSPAAGERGSPFAPASSL
jgi:hypothetical protein